MKNSTLLLLFVALFSGCTDKVEITRVFSVLEPVYMSPQEIRSSIAILEPEQIEATGKIYMYKQYLLINEPDKGIHIVNNQDPERPENIRFISIPGNYDVSVRGDILYADSYVDLVAFDIRNMDNITEVERLENVFLNSATATYYNQERGVIIDWIEVEKVTINDEQLGGVYPEYFWYKGNLAYSSSATFDASALRSSFMPPSTLTGTGGSMARFTIVDDHMYAVDQSNLYVFNISDLENPVKKGEIVVGWGLETIFPYNQSLFVGSQTGMHIFSIAQPGAPVKLSLFEHIRRCDPVVVQDTLAYVTLRGGTACGGNSNELQIVNIKDLTRPHIVAAYPMTNPYGLGIDDKSLFVCDGMAGLKVYHVSDIYNLENHRIMTYPAINAIDVIPFNDLLIAIASEGIYQFDYSDLSNIRLLSAMPVIKQEPGLSSVEK